MTPMSSWKKTADAVIDLIGRAQQNDGYINTFFTVKEPENRWTNLRDQHELYCAGHLIEAAVAYYQVTGKRKFLEIVSAFADYIASVFGTGEGQLQGYDGHQEIELALVKLYRVTGKEAYLSLSQFFIDERGKQPHFFDGEKKKRGEERPSWWRNNKHGVYSYHQAHQHVRAQEEAVGHSVRAVYMYSAMADLAAETDDHLLKAACERLWQNVTKRQMYITGGIGSSEYGEAFTFDYDLPNDTCYTETCASIGLVFWARRMLQLEARSDYADVMERALYNGTISGMDLDGKRFFYVNPLEVWPQSCEIRNDKKHVKPERQKWFSCACCPPNLARLISSIGHYIYSADEHQAFVHLYIGNESELTIGNTLVKLKQTTNYPWNGDITLDVLLETASEFTLALRVPGWCSQATLTINDEPISIEKLSKQGYVYLTRKWKDGDRIKWHFTMEVQRMKANPNVRTNANRVALQRGPIVYCLEETDNGAGLPNISLPTRANLRAEFATDLLGGVVTIKGDALRADEARWSEKLYQPAPANKVKTEVTAIPYYAWCNREPGEMLVWIHETGI